MFGRSEQTSGPTFFDKLRGRGALSEADVDAALREVRTALLEADVALPVVRQFIDEVRPKAVGSDVIRSVTPGQMVIKLVHDHLVEMLGGTVADLDLNAISAGRHPDGRPARLGQKTTTLKRIPKTKL